MVLGPSSCHRRAVPGFLLSCSSPFQVVQRIKAVETETRLLVVDKETDEYLCSLRLTCTEEMVHSGILLNSGVSPTKSAGSDNGEVWKPQLDLSGGSLQRHSHSFSSHGSRKDLKLFEGPKWLEARRAMVHPSSCSAQPSSIVSLRGAALA
ncbi:hypothetical protein QYF61_009006 [Mycteria americana]|uniref:Uncharacterized protein n=1 Tax=Mycteria americana TaxID=33587 RepID=A0AAN7NKU6_MYCAM|nr:hypothetical protein QYF61_009006 [Mycteria americana]